MLIIIPIDLQREDEVAKHKAKERPKP
jgi:hypothetical protein